MSVDAETVAWQHLADSCLEHDADHCRRACEALRAIFLPDQREQENDDAR